MSDNKNKKSYILPVLATVICVLLAVIIVLLCIILSDKNSSQKDDVTDNVTVTDADGTGNSENYGDPKDAETEDPTTAEPSSDNEASSEDPTPEEPSSDNEASSEETPDEEIPVEDYMPMTTIETPYITLEYPEAWAEILFVEYGAAEEGYKLSFNGIGEFAGFNVFTFNLGEKIDGYYELGTLNTENGTAGVYSFVNEDMAGYTEEQKDRLYEIQANVNEIITQFYECEDFTPSGR